MFFRKKKDSHTKKIDKLVTGLIIGGAVASMIGLSKTEKGKKVIHDIKESDFVKSGVKEDTKNFFGKGYELFGKTLAKIVSLFDKKD